MKYLIVNADDFGRNPQINIGIIKACKEGIVTSTSVLANFPAFSHACALAKEHPQLSVGLHFNLTEGGPVSSPKEIPSLVTKNGFFYAKWLFVLRASLGLIRPEHILFEFEKQWEKASLRFLLTHLDSHHHIHALRPVFKSIKKSKYFAQVRQIRVIRFPADTIFKIAYWEQLFVNFFQDTKIFNNEIKQTFGFELFHDKDKRKQLIRILQRLPDGKSELICHPGFSGDSDKRDAKKREQELEALCDIKIKEILNMRKIKLTSWRS